MSNLYHKEHFNGWNNGLGKNFTNNNGYYKHNMDLKNIETGGGYQASVSGAYGEFTVSSVLKSLPDCYHIINDILLSKGNKIRKYQPEIYGKSPWKVVQNKGKYYEVVPMSTQIDHLIVSPYGIFIIETKNHKGFIFGDINSKVWTQVLNGESGNRAYCGRSHYTFYNPVKQNQGHLENLSKQLMIPINCMIGMIVFTSPDAYLGNVNCNCCYTLDMLYEAILSFNKQLWSNKQTIKLIHMIENINKNSYLKSKEHEIYVKDIQHRQEINRMLKMQGR